MLQTSSGARRASVWNGQLRRVRRAGRRGVVHAEALKDLLSGAERPFWAGPA
jgi:hypothetical protein